MFIHGNDGGIDLGAANRKEPQAPQAMDAISWPRTLMGASAGLPSVGERAECQQFPLSPINPMGKRPMRCAPVVGVPSPSLAESWPTSMSKSMRKHPLPCYVTSGSATAGGERALPMASACNRQSPTDEYATAASLARMLWTAPAHSRPVDYTDTDIVATFIPQCLTTRATKGMLGHSLSPLRSVHKAVSPTRRSIRAGPCAVFYSNAETATTAPQPEIGFQPPPLETSGSRSFFSTANGTNEPLSYYHSLIATDATPADGTSLALLDDTKEKENVGAACDRECGLTRRRRANEFRCGRTDRASLGAVASSMASWVLTSE